MFNIWYVLFVILLVIIVIYFILNHDFTVSEFTTCDLSFNVLPKKDSALAAEKLCILHTKNMKFINFLENKYGPADETVRLLKSNYQYSDLVETSHGSETVNKTSGPFDKIYIHLRRADDSFYDDDTVMFVMVHELTHVTIPGFMDSFHKSDFWKKNAQMLRDASAAGVLPLIDYSQYHQEYNGKTIKFNPGLVY